MKELQYHLLTTQLARSVNEKIQRLQNVHNVGLEIGFSTNTNSSINVIIEGTQIP